MAKKRTSRKREFSFEDMPITKFKPGVKFAEYDPTATLKDRDFIFKALWECLMDDDVESFKEILRTHLEVVNKRNLAKKSRLSRRTLHRMLSPEGNPTLANVAKVIHALCG